MLTRRSFCGRLPLGILALSESTRLVRRDFETEIHPTSRLSVDAIDLAYRGYLHAHRLSSERCRETRSITGRWSNGDGEQSDATLRLILAARTCRRMETKAS
jgi:hypothetical protein